MPPPRLPSFLPSFLPSILPSILPSVLSFHHILPSYPAIDFTRSGTRREELLTDKAELQKMWILRKIVHPMGEIDAMEFLIDKLAMTKTNDEFFEAMKKQKS